MLLCLPLMEKSHLHAQWWYNFFGMFNCSISVENLQEIRTNKLVVRFWLWKCLFGSGSNTYSTIKHSTYINILNTTVWIRLFDWFFHYFPFAREFGIYRDLSDDIQIFFWYSNYDNQHSWKSLTFTTFKKCSKTFFVMLIMKLKSPTLCSIQLTKIGFKN